MVKADKENRYTAVLKAASELFASKSLPSWEDALHFEELCLRLLPKIDLQAKSEIAERLGQCSALPKSIALTLAKDDIAVAAPIVRNFQAFNDTDLLMIIARGSMLHALAVAARTDLSDTVMVALSKKSLPTFDTSVDQKKNDAGSMSRDYKKAVSEIANNAMAADLIEEGASKARLDMDVDNAPVASKTQRRLVAVTTASKGDGKQSRETKRVLSPLERFLSLEHAHVLTQAHTAVENASHEKANPALILKQAYRRADRAREFTQLARERKLDQFANLLNQECKLKQTDAQQVIQDNNGFALAICLKSLALPTHVANEAFLLLNPDLGKNKEQIFLLNWFYGQITPTAALSIMKDWQALEPAKKQAPHAPIHSGKTRTEKARPVSQPRETMPKQKRIQISVVKR